jgi:uncharacterized protein (DUF1697 family)
LGLNIALLRGINVGGHKQVAMAELRHLLSRLGFGDARSLLQSGNLVFRSEAQAGPQLERLLEAEAEKRLGLQTEFFVRAAAQWKTIVADNPFRKEAVSDPGRLVVVLLKEAPDVEAVKALQAAIIGPEIVRAKGRQAYVVFPHGIGRSRLTHTLIEKKLGTRGTGRNWNTVLKLGVLAEA